MTDDIKTKASIFSVGGTSFSQQLIITFSAGIVLLTFITTFAISRLTHNTLKERITEDGKRITHVFAEQSTLALLYQSPDNAQDIAKAVMGFPDVMGVAIYDQSQETLFSSGDIPLVMGYKKLNLDQLMIDYETDEAWYYIAPVYSHPENSDEADSPFSDTAADQELIGYVRLIMSKETLHSMASGILRSNIMISSALAIMILMVLYFITRRMTKPLQNLASIMRRADEGEHYIRAEVGGPKDIIHMEHAFNTMMEVLEAREDELKRNRDAALETARVKTEFAANVTHELRTPMNGVLGMLELLQDMGLNTKQHEYVKIARNSAESLLLLINDILDFSKGDAGKARFETEDFFLDELVNEVVSLLKIQGNEKKIALRPFYDRNIPNALRGVPTRIRQILINLIGNAIKFTEEGHVNINIEFTDNDEYRDLDEPFHLKFVISDTGIGIPEDYLGRIFDAFLQVDGSSTRKYSGSGLGLAISRQLVEYMGGEIHVDSKVGKGSKFWFILPMSKANAEPVKRDTAAEIILNERSDTSQTVATIAEESQEVSEADVILKQNNTEDMHLLVVDDNRTNQQVAIGMLERLNYKVTVASSGQEALDTIFKEKFALVLMDIQMPGMDGYEVTDYIRSMEMEGTRIPIIAMTANIQKSDVEHCLEVGMDDFIPKPLKLNVLQDKLTSWLVDKDSAEKRDIVSDTLTDDVQDSKGVIDYNTLNELKDSVGEAFDHTISVFLEDLPMNLKTLRESFSENDAVTTQRAAHTLKGSSRAFGALKFADYCKDMEDKARDGDLSSANIVLDVILTEAEKVIKALSKIDNNEHNTSADVWRERDKRAFILVVDDQRDVRVAIRSVLEREGYEVNEAGNGSQAISMCERRMPDLILMDAMMPGMDGFKATQQLQLMPGGDSTPVLIVTALDDAGSIEKAFSVGATDYVPKPVNYKVLCSRISRLLDASLAQKHVRHLAYHDPLTGLPNRATFTEQLGKLVKHPRSDGKMLAVMFIDLDRFKLVNDTLGHEVGDLLLKAASERLSGAVRESDIVARLGGDEFTIILNGITSADDVARIAEKICKRMSESFVFMDQKMFVTSSIGISIYPIDGLDANELIKHADTAMFRAKEKRNDYQFYELGMETLIAKRLHLENALRNAIKQNEFILFYQPQINLANDKLHGMEALIRWKHPEKGMIPPSDFIPLAEETGLIVEMGEWVMQEGCRQLKEWLDKGYEAVKLSINLSGRQLEDEKLITKFSTIIELTQVPAELIELEITESAIMKNPDAAIPVLEKFKNMGLSLSIDDFGTGHSSLNYLRKFPIDILKIDRSFVSDITTSPDDAAIITGIIALAKSLRLQVVAEGVETAEQQAFLKECKCDFVQGFFFYKPMPADVLELEVLSHIRLDKATNF